ncbi:MAG TPA: Holliday junction branch migration protein RuvA [Candidatus Paceibacterota bacterium]
MIRSLTGEITHVADGYLTVAVNGIGYLVGATTKTTLYSVGERVTLHTHLAVRETALDLYGFQTLAELDLFELLLEVPKIGPKSALQIMGQASPTLLIEAISKKDDAYLHKLSGIGKKTCENIVQALHDKIEKMSLAFAVTATGGLTDAQTDAIDALVSLGYDLATARETVKQLDGATATPSELIQQALKQMT